LTLCKTLLDNYEALKKLESGKTGKDVAVQYKVPPNTLSTLIKNKEKIMKAFEGGDSHSQRKQRAGNHDAVDKALYKIIAKYLGISLLAGTGGKLVSHAATLFTSCSEYFFYSPLLCRSILIS